MKQTIIMLFSAAFFYYNANAQVSEQLAGKKFQVVSIFNTTISQMGQEIPSVIEFTNGYEIKTVSGKTVSLTGTAKKIKIKVTMMGNEQTIDSEDSSSRNDPQYAEAFANIDKPKDVTVEVGKTSVKNSAAGGQDIADIANILFIPISATSAEGTKSIDSAVSDNGSKSIDTITVTKLTPDEITVQVNSKLVLSGTEQSMGVDVKTNILTTSIAIRVYDVKTGLLKSETQTFESNGTNEAQGQSIPMSMKGTSTITVQ